MKIYLATDHAGFELKEKIKSFLLEKNLEVEDCGASEFNKDDDYPDLISKAAQAVSNDSENARGLIFGGSGEGEAMVANKFPNVRCALFYSTAIPIEAADATGRTSTDPFEIIRLTRQHNNANMLSIGARFVDVKTAIAVVEQWLNEPFPGDPRHVRRVNKIKKIESNL